MVLNAGFFWLVIRSSLPPRSLQGRPARHSLRHRREGERKKRGAKSPCAQEVLGDLEEEMAEKRERETDKQGEE